MRFIPGFSGSHTLPPFTLNQYRIFQLSVGHAGSGRVLVRQEPEEGGVLLCLEPLEAFPGVPFRLEGIEVRVREGQGREGVATPGGPGALGKPREKA